MQIYRIREGKFLVPFLLEDIYEYVFDENPCLLLSRNKGFTYHEISEIMYRVYTENSSFNKDYTSGLHPNFELAVLTERHVFLTRRHEDWFHPIN